MKYIELAPDVAIIRPSRQFAPMGPTTVSVSDVHPMRAYGWEPVMERTTARPIRFQSAPLSASCTLSPTTWVRLVREVGPYNTM